jgi:hypothetical protein
MPYQHGFDQYFGVPYSVDMGMAYNNRSAEASFEGGYYGCTPLPLVVNETVVEQPVDFDTLNRKYTDAATTFIERAAADAQPFLLYLAYGHVHTPQYAGVDFEGKSKRGVFGDSVMELDASVGELNALLKNLGIEEDTLVFLTSDVSPRARAHSACGRTCADTRPPHPRFAFTHTPNARANRTGRRTRRSMPRRGCPWGGGRALTALSLARRRPPGKVACACRALLCGPAPWPRTP